MSIVNLDKRLHPGVKQFEGVDFLKFIMAFCVVAIHVESASCVSASWPEPIVWLIRMAVPFFFICSGFLIEYHMNDRKTAFGGGRLLIRRSFKTFRLFVMWLLIYLPITVYLDAGNGKGIVHNLIAYAGRVIVSGESQCAYPLWFIYSMSIVLIIYGLLYKVKRIEVVLFAVFAVITAVNSSPPVNRFHEIFTLLTSRTLGGGVYIMAGILICRLRRLPSALHVLCLLLVSVLLFILHLPYWELLGGTAIFAIALQIQHISASASLRMRYMSMWIYYLHMYFVFALSLFFNRRGVVVSPYVFFVEIACPVAVLSLLLAILQQNRRFSWLRILVG